MRSTAGLGRDFRRVWLATGVTTLGVQVAQLAMPLLALTTLHATSMQVGLLGSAQWLPFLVIALPLGAFVDRHPRGPLLVVAEAVRAAATAVVVLLGLLRVLSLPLLVMLAIVIGCGTVLFEVAYQSFLPSVVERGRLDSANSRLQATEATATVAGPALGGLLVRLVGALATLGVTAVASLLSAASLSRASESFTPDDTHSRSRIRDLLHGVRFLRRDRVLGGLLGFSALANPFAQWITLLFVIDAIRRLHLTSGQVGIVLALGGLGTFLGAASAPSVSRRIGPLRAIMITATVDPLVLFALPAAGPGWRPALLVVGLGGALAINGYAVGLDTVIVTTVRQARTPDALRGRVNAATRMVTYGSMTLGGVLAGTAAQHFGTRAGLLIGCGGALTSTAWIAVWARRVVRHGDRLDTSDPAEQALRAGAVDRQCNVT